MNSFPCDITVHSIKFKLWFHNDDTYLPYSSKHCETVALNKERNCSHPKPPQTPHASIHHNYAPKLRQLSTPASRSETFRMINDERNAMVANASVLRLSLFTLLNLVALSLSLSFIERGE